MKVERSARSGQVSRQRLIRASVLSCAAGRFIRVSTEVEACWNGMSR